jgi:hypothetical protein
MAVEKGRGRWGAEVQAAFVKGLAETGNVQAAAARAGVTAAACYGRRKADPAFAARWSDALESRRTKAQARIVRTSPWGVQRVRCNRQWSETAEEAFLDALASSCNVTLSCDEAGVGASSVYRQRRRRPDFAAKWQGALDQGYARLEMATVEAAVAAIEGRDHDPARPIPPMSVETVLKVLTLHRAAVKGVGRRSGWQVRRRPLAEVKESILRKLEAIEAARVAGLLK